MNENTQTEEADLKERLEGFNNELKPLLGKYELGIAALAQIMPNGTIGANPVIVSMRQQKVAEEAKVEEEVAKEAEPLTE